MWSHRLVSTIDETGSEYLEIAEVFFDSNKLPYAYGVASIVDYEIDGISKQVAMLASAMDKEILKYPEHFTGNVNI
jgi:hypothetical protein